MAKAKATAQNILPAPVAALYDISEGVLAKFVCPEHGHVDLTCMTLELAERLAAKGYLKALQQTAE